jgi:NTP pyrophosphatase (non-canonical NTP hydrolase)
MTNQQLKAHCEDVIANPQDHLDWVVDMAKEALAALTQPASQALKLADEDYFSRLVAAARERAEKAMRKFPQPNYVLNKVAEESGEVIKAVIHYTEGREDWLSVEGELIDNLAMLIRLVKEGDQVIGFNPPDEVKRLNAPHTAPIEPICATGGAEWVKCSERMPVIDKRTWRTPLPVLVSCELGVIPAYARTYTTIGGERKVGFMASLTLGNARGKHPESLYSSEVLTQVTMWREMPAAPED